MTDPVTPIVVKALVDITVKAVPWADFYQKYRSYNLLIIGQERSGKTTLYNFLYHRLLGLSDAKTKPTVGSVDSGCFVFEWKTKDGSTLSVGFRNIGDQSGQRAPSELAKLVTLKKPHLVIIVLDITTPAEGPRIHESYLNWLNDFCIHLAELLRKSPKTAAKLDKKLRQMIVVLNKVDCLPATNRKDVIDAAQENVRAVLKDRLEHHLGDRVAYFPILPCSIVRDPKDNKLDETISRLQQVVESLVVSTTR